MMEIIRKVFIVTTVVLFLAFGCAALCIHLYIQYGVEPDYQNCVPFELGEKFLFYRIGVYWLFILYLVFTIIYLSMSILKMRKD